jgi:RNA polymerase sigma factor (sigma-70 family)
MTSPLRAQDNDPARDAERARVNRLVDAYRGDDQEALGELYRTYYPFAVRSARRYASDVHEADDLAQDAFLRVALALRRSQGGVFHLRGYLDTTVRRLAGRTAKKQGPARPVGDIGQYERPVVEHFPEDGDLETAFQSLPRRWRLALWLRVVEGRSRRDVGAELGISCAAAGMLVMRALNGLRTAYFAGVTPGSAGHRRGDPAQGGGRRREVGPGRLDGDPAMFLEMATPM